MNHPELHVELHFSDHMVDLVDDRFDLAIRMRSPGRGADLVSRRLAQEETIICASPNYLESRGTPRTLEDLRAHHAITYAFSDRAQPWKFADADEKFEELTPPSRVRLGDLEAVADAATRGLGLAWLPTWLIGERLRGGELQRLLPHVPPLISDVHLTWMQSSHLPLRIRAAIDALVEGVPQQIKT